MKLIHLSTDGSMLKNIGGWAFVLRDENSLIKDSGAEITKRGINHFELVAIINGLMRLDHPCRVKIYTDSNHVIHHACQPETSHLFRVAKLWKLFLGFRKIHQIEFIKVGSNKFHDDQRLAHHMAKEAIYDFRSTLRQQDFTENPIGTL